MLDTCQLTSNLKCQKYNLLTISSTVHTFTRSPGANYINRIKFYTFKIHVKSIFVIIFFWFCEQNSNYTFGEMSILVVATTFEPKTFTKRYLCYKLNSLWRLVILVNSDISDAIGNTSNFSSSSIFFFTNREPISVQFLQVFIFIIK